MITADIKTDVTRQELVAVCYKFSQKYQKTFLKT